MLRLRLARALLAAGLVLAGAGCTESPEARKQAALDRGQAALRDGKVNEAVIEFQNALQIDRDLVPALHGLGRAYAAKHWTLDAVRELRRAHRLAPGSLPIASDFGRALVEAGDWSEAEAQATVILARDPRSPTGLYLRAGAHIVQSRLEEALAVLAGLPTAESFPGAELARAEALFGLGRVDQARQVLEASLTRDASDARSLAGLAVISLTRKDYGAAERLYAQAKELQPLDPRIRLGLAAAKARLGRIREAIDELEGVEDRARTGPVLLALGHYYIQADRPAQAIHVLGPLVTHAPDFTQGRYLLAVAYLAGGEPERAFDAFQILEGRQPRDPSIQFRLAQAETVLGRPREALARLDSLASVYGRIAEYQIERGRSLARLGRLSDAVQAAATAQRIDPGLAQAYLLQGDIQVLRGDMRAAREMFTRGAEVGVDLAPARLALGRFLLTAGDTEPALRELEAAVRADPRSIAATRTRAVALSRLGRNREAIELVQGAIKAAPGAPGFHALLAVVHLADRKPGRAVAAFRKELEVAPRSIEARMGLAAIALRRGNEAEAMGRLEEVVDLRPDHRPAVLLLASLYARQGRADLSVPMLEAAVKKNREPGLILPLGDLYVKVARYDDAITLVNGVLRQSPDLSAAQRIRGQAHLGKGNAEAALKDLTAAARSNPSSADVWHLLGHAHASLGQLREARAAYAEALRLDPQHVLARLERAALADPPTDDAAAAASVAALRTAVTKDPKNVLLRETLVRALFLRRDGAGALRELREVLALAPLHMGANFLAARALLQQQGRADRAARYLEVTLRTNPLHVQSLVLQAQYLNQRGRLPEAIRFLENALGVDPAQPEIKYQLGALYLQQEGRLDDAMATAQELERGAPGGFEGPLLRGAVLARRGELRGALEAYRNAARLNPRALEAHRGLGQAYEALGDGQRAVQSYERALAIKPTDAVTLNNLAWVLSEMRKTPEQALPLAVKATLLAPDSADMLDTLGWVQYRQGAYREAERALTRAVERAPGQATAHYHLGMTYHRLGKKTEALYSLRRASQLDPALAERERLPALLRDLSR